MTISTENKPHVKPYTQATVLNLGLCKGKSALY